MRAILSERGRGAAHSCDDGRRIDYHVTPGTVRRDTLRARIIGGRRMAIADRIKNTQLGSELTDQQAGVIADLGAVNKLAAGDYLIEEGSTDDSLHVLFAGKLEVVKTTAMGEEATLHVLREGDTAGELSFVDGMKHSLGLRALSDCEVFSLKRSDFETLITKDPLLVYSVMRAIMRSAHRTLHRMNHQHIELSNYIYKQHGRY
jgi:CRP-like cAMP-binding protein